MRNKKELLTIFTVTAAVSVLVAAIFPMYKPLGKSAMLSSEDRAIVDHILQEHEDDFQFVSRVKFSRVDITSPNEKVFYFRSDTFFGIPKSKARVFYRDGQIVSGEVISASEQFK